MLSWCLKIDAEKFIDKYSGMVTDLRARKRRLIAHLEALSTIINEQGKQLLTDEDIEGLLEQEELYTLPEVVNEVFHLEQIPYVLPQFLQRLRNFRRCMDYDERHESKTACNTF